MNRLGLSGVLVALMSACVADEGPEVGSVEAPVAAVTVYRSSFKGTAAHTWFGDELSGGYIDVWQGGTVATPTAGLSYNTYVVDPTSQVCTTESYCRKGDPACTDPVEYTHCTYTRYTYEYGYGQIPAADFQIRGGTARVDTIVAAGPTFWIDRCEIDYGNPENPYACGTGGGGVITIAWMKDGVSSSIWTGTSRWSSGKYSVHTQGNGSQQSAVADGTLVGRDVANTAGAISRSHGASVSKDVVANPRPVR